MTSSFYGQTISMLYLKTTGIFEVLIYPLRYKSTALLLPAPYGSPFYEVLYICLLKYFALYADKNMKVLPQVKP